MNEQDIRKKLAGTLAPLGLKVCKGSDGRWAIVNRAGRIIAGTSDLQTLVYVVQIIAADPHPERFQEQTLTGDESYKAGVEMARKLKNGK